MSTRRHQPSTPSINEGSHVLLAGGSSDIRTIRALLLDLPGTAYGQVFIEVASPIQVVSLPAPPRVSVTWLFRHSRSHDSARGIPIIRGELVADAVSAWISEWLPVDLIEPDLIEPDLIEPDLAELRASGSTGAVIGASVEGASGDYYLWIGCAESQRTTAVYHELAAILSGSAAAEQTGRHGSA